MKNTLVKTTGGLIAEYESGTMHERPKIKSKKMPPTDFQEKVIETYEKVAVLGVTPHEAFEELLSAVSELVEECMEILPYDSVHRSISCANEREKVIAEIRQRFRERGIVVK